ncbi:glycosyltransferase family A protein [Gloeocapsopsis sp. IPPAS B-1203]|uniref:glycosyltransferase family 2 protein n=1 Tax=Gloeocapsopsis sp. IPPAS B-1203 TaxID=2049454 RepID=UPI000C180E9C|nr:glycosyltransferase family A protein [Gloeocapsopsis sp. IPPAS B-1203]PIG94123.1 glycosyl transferase family A [Gloeocapsopsis sp. IPPAS B-1203]
MPQVSVIIPAYNAMNYLPETLDSLLKQTFDDFETIIVNDGSTDEIERWAAQITDPRVKLISQENRGLAAARNTGIAHAQGEYLAFLDADDLWKPTKLEKQVQSLQSNPDVGLVYTWTVVADPNGKPTGRVFASLAEGNVWKKLTEFNIVGCGSVAMVRRSCFEKVGVFDRNLGSWVEDWDMWLRIASSYPFAVIKEPLVYYRQHLNNGSKNLQAMEQNFYKVIEKTFNSVPANLQFLKKRSYGLTNLFLAWKVLQAKNQDYKLVSHYWKLAFVNSPRLLFFQSFINLTISIGLIRCLGLNGYNKTLTLINNLRRLPLSIGQ